MQGLVAITRIVFAAAFSLILIDASQAQQPVEVETDAGVITMVATVEDIDVTRQLVTVVGPNNNWVVVKIGPEHINLIKLKEKITISYADEVAVALRKVPQAEAGGAFAADEEAGMDMDSPTAAEQDWVEATPTGATDLTTVEITDTIAAINRNKPTGATDLTTVEITDAIAAINRNKRTITFAGTGGKTRTIAIATSVAGFDQVAVGDMVVLEVTRAVAISVKPV